MRLSDVYAEDRDRKDGPAMTMTPHERAKNIAGLLNYESHLADSNFAAVVKEIEAAEREAFGAAVEKAAAVLEDHGCSDCTDAIRKLEP